LLGDTNQAEKLQNQERNNKKKKLQDFSNGTREKEHYL
jgi:hypothetical protein